MRATKNTGNFICIKTEELTAGTQDVDNAANFPAQRTGEQQHVDVFIVRVARR